MAKQTRTQKKVVERHRARKGSMCGGCGLRMRRAEKRRRSGGSKRRSDRSTEHKPCQFCAGKAAST